MNGNAEAAEAERTANPKAEKAKLAYAIAYARHGFRVFPCHEIESDGECSCGKLGCSSAGKHPRIAAWQDEATTDDNRIIRTWWGKWPNANIGVACGAASNLLALDVDVKNGHDGIASLRDLELENGELPCGPIALTPTGGNIACSSMSQGSGMLRVSRTVSTFAPKAVSLSASGPEPKLVLTFGKQHSRSGTISCRRRRRSGCLN